MSIETTILHVIIIINPRFKILSDDEYNTFAIYHTINTRDMLREDMVKLLCAFNLKWYSCRWHPVSKEWSHHCNFTLACADYVCRCLPMNILLLFQKPMVCDTDNFSDNHKKAKLQCHYGCFIKRKSPKTNTYILNFRWKNFNSLF